MPAEMNHPLWVAGTEPHGPPKHSNPFAGFALHVSIHAKEVKAMAELGLIASVLASSFARCGIHGEVPNRIGTHVSSWSRTIPWSASCSARRSKRWATNLRHRGRPRATRRIPRRGPLDSHLMRRRTWIGRGQRRFPVVEGHDPRCADFPLSSSGRRHRIRSLKSDAVILRKPFRELDFARAIQRALSAGTGLVPEPI